MVDPEDLVEDLVCQCLQAREAGCAATLQQLLEAQPAAIREQVAAMLDTLDRVGLAGEAVPAPGDALALPFGPYLLLERLGAGTMGVVYRARGPDGVERALKLLQPGLLPVRSARLRFAREVQALRELDHPGICPILDAGEVDGVPFLVMPLLPGESLQARFARGPARDGAARQRLLAILERLAAALHHAHERGFVHRDVKPANVLVGDDDRPVVLDFGLARLDRDGAPSLSRSHEVIGAPAYMAPEQIADGRAVDRRADVHALGVLLYEGLTGRCPYEAATRESLYRRILTGDAAPPSRRVPDLPGALDVVCLTALAREPDRRYQTAADFAADLARVQRGERPLAQLPGPLERTRRWIRRNPMPSTLVALLTFAMAGVLLQTLRERRTSARDRARVLAAESLAVLPSDPARAERLGLQAHALAPDVTETLTAIEAARAAEREEFVLAGHTQPITDLAFAADGERLLTASRDGTARLWHLRTGAFLSLPHGGDGPALAAIQPHGDLVVTAGHGDGRLCAWNARNGAPVWQQDALPAGSAIRVLQWSPDGRWLLAGGEGGARLWTADGASRELATTPAAITAGAWLASDEVVVGTGPRATGQTEGTHWLRTFRIGAGATATIVPTTDQPLDDGVAAVHARPQAPGTLLVVGTSGTVHLMPGWRQLEPRQKRGVQAAGWAADGERAFTISRGGTLAEWTADGAWISTTPTLTGPTSFVPHPTQPFAAVGGAFGVVQLRSYQGPAARRLGLRRIRPLPLAFSPDGSWLAASDWNHTVRIWPLRRRQHPILLVGDAVRSAVWSRDGSRVVTGGHRSDNRGIVRCWDASTGDLLAPDLLLDTPVSKLLPDPARDRIVALHGTWNTGRARIVASAAGELRGQDDGIGPPDLAHLPLAGQLLADGRLVASEQEAGWFVGNLDRRTVELRWPMAAPAAGTEGTPLVLAVAATADGATVWCGGSSGFLQRFDRRGDGTYAESAAQQLGEAMRALEWIDDGSLLCGLANGILQLRRPDRDGLDSVIPFAGHRDDVCDVDWTRTDGELLVASGDFGGSVRLWRGDGTLLREIRAHTGPVWSVRFSPRGDRLLTGSADGTARIWPVVLDVGR